MEGSASRKHTIRVPAKVDEVLEEIRIKLLKLHVKIRARCTQE
jgi:hypothetical protein